MDTEPVDTPRDDEPLFAESPIPGGARTLLAGIAMGSLGAVAGFIVDIPIGRDSIDLGTIDRAFGVRRARTCSTRPSWLPC